MANAAARPQEIASSACPPSCYTTCHIPDSSLVQNVTAHELATGAVRLTFPTPTAGWLGELALKLREAGETLVRRHTADLIRTLDALNGRWADAETPERQEADQLLASVTGYPAAVITPALDHLFAALRASHLEATLTEELGNAHALDEWVENAVLGRRSRAFGPRLTVLIASGNVPMAAIPSLVYTLLLRSPVLVKQSSDEPVLAGLYLRSLAAADPDLGRACAAVWWPGGEESIETVVLPHADAVIAFGGEQALRALSMRLSPEVRFQPHGHRIGFGVIGRERLTCADLPALATAAARDVAEFDQQGCVAPQRLFVEQGGEVTPREFAAALADAIAAHAAEWPRVSIPPAAAAAIHQLRAAAEVRAMLQPEAVLYASPGGTDWTVFLDPEPGFGPGCLFRTVIIHPVDDLSTVSDIVAPLGPYLQTAAAAVSPERLMPLVECMARVGLTRICPLGRTQRPASGWRPDGRPRLTDLVRWVEWETQ